MIYSKLNLTNFNTDHEPKKLRLKNSLIIHEENTKEMNV